MNAPDPFLPAWETFRAVGLVLTLDAAGRLLATPRERMTDELRALAKANKRDFIRAARGRAAATQALQQLGKDEADLRDWWDGRDYWSLGYALERGFTAENVLGCMRAALESAERYTATP